MWDLIVAVPDYCVSFYFGMFQTTFTAQNRSQVCLPNKSPMVDRGEIFVSSSPHISM